MQCLGIYFCSLLLIFGFDSSRGLFLVVPEDVAQGLTAVYGFAPRLFKGIDSRFGFGFRFGNLADFQIMYELGPQTTKLEPLRARSTYYQRLRTVRRRPFIQLLLRSGLVRDNGHDFDVLLEDEEIDQPR